jgi:glycosyltransferase involved in cell wall biosynthesis
MRILYTNPFLTYPLVDGGRLVSFQHVRGLSVRGHELTMVFPLRRPTDAKHVPVFEEFGAVRTVTVPSASAARIALGAFFTRRSLRIQRHRLPTVLAEFERALEKPVDLVLLDTLFTSYLVPVCRRLRPEVPIAMLAHNVESQMYERLAREGNARWRALGLWETSRIRSAEIAAAAVVDRVLTLSEEDAATIREMQPAAQARTVGAGVTTYPGMNLPRPSGPPRVLFLGSYQWPPNRDAVRWLVEDIWPRVRERVPDATLTLAGNDPKGFATPWTRPEDGVEGVGFVESAAETVRGAHVVVVPLRSGGGIRVKILETLANARPVVTTALGVEGIPLRDETHLLVRDTASAIADAIVMLFGDPERAALLASNGRRFVEEHYSWTAAADRMNAALVELVTEHARRPRRRPASP